LSEPDIRGVIIALENEIQKELANGRIIRLEKLGSLYPSISSNGVATAEEFTAAEIRKIGVRYRPGKRILDSVRAAGLKKEG
jgi:predicted histone-like DNA-binding protein